MSGNDNELTGKADEGFVDDIGYGNGPGAIEPKVREDSLAAEEEEDGTELEAEGEEQEEEEGQEVEEDSEEVEEEEEEPAKKVKAKVEEELQPNSILIQQLEELYDMLQQPQAAVTSTAAAEVKEAVEEVLDIDISDEEFEDAQSSKDGLKKLLLKATKNADARAERKANARVEELLKGFTENMMKQVAIATTQSNIANKFFEKYPTLAPYWKGISVMLNTISKKNPNASIKERWDILEKEATQLYGIKIKKVSDSPRNVSAKGRQVPGTTKRGAVASRAKSRLQTELDELSPELLG